MKIAAKRFRILRRKPQAQTMSRNSTQLGLGLFLVLFVLASVFYTRANTHTRVYAAVPTTLNFQARLLNSGGAIVPDANYSVTFKLYDASSGGTNVWTETQGTVQVKSGYLSVYLGSVNTALSTLDWSQQYWLTMNVNGDGEMNPRLKLTSVPYAFQSGQADRITNGAGSLTANDLAQLGPSTPQVVNLVLSALRINQTGAGGLLQLQGNGTDAFTVSKTGDLVSSGSGTFSGGSLTVGTAAQAGSLMLKDGSNDTFTLQTGSQSGNLTFTLPTGYGSSGDCLKGNGSGVLSFGGCGGANSFVNGGNSFGGLATLGTTDSNSLKLITAGAQAMLIDTSGNVRIGSSGSPSEKLDVNGGIRIGTTANANAGTIRWTGSDFEGYNGSQWISFTTGAGNANASTSFVSGLANAPANGTGTVVETLLFTSATAVSNTAGVTGFTAPAAGSFRTCLIKNNAAVTGGTLNLRWRVNGVSIGSGACTMNTTKTRESSTVLNANVVTFAAGDTIGIAFDTVGLAPTTNDFTVYWSVEYNSSAAASSATLQDAYNNSTAPATITSASGKDLKVVLADTATDANMLVNIATGSTGRFAVQDNGTDVLAVTSTAITLSKPVSATAGLDLSNSGIANAGSITGIGANLTAAGSLTIASSASGNLTLNSASGLAILGATTLRTADSLAFDLQKATDTVLSLQNSGAGVANINLADGGLQTGGTLRLSNGGALQNITGLSVISGGASISGNVTLGGASTDRIMFTGQVLGASPLVFQGVTDNSFTTTLAVVDPTANNTITLPNASGTLVLDSRSILAGTGLSGGGDLSADRTLNLDINGLSSVTSVNPTDYVAIYNGVGIKKIARSDFLQGLTGALQYRGTWNASTNTPTLSDATGAAGDEYAVTTGGTRDLGSGSITFGVGDFVIHNGTKWQLAPSSSAVTSVFGRTGAITGQNGDYTASQITNVAAGGISSVTVQAALNELDSEKLGSLNGLTVSSQTFANDTNVTITSSGSTHTLGWSGQLSVARGGTGASTFTSNGVLYGNGTGALQVTSAGTGGQLLLANSSGVPTFTTLSGDATISDTGVLTIGADKVALGTDTTGSYIASLGALTGLSATGNSGEGSTPTLSVIYGNTANTSVQGNTTLVCASGTGNLSGGGTTITLGSGGTCGSLNTQAAVSFATSVTTPILTSAGGLSITSAASGDITFNSGTNKLVIDSSDIILQRTGAGAFAIDLNDGSATTLLLENTGAGVANLNLSDGGLQVAGTTVLTNGLVLQNVTADTGILTSGLLPVARGGTGAGSFTANGIIYGNGTGVLQVTGAGLTNQCLIATTGGAPSWGSCSGGAGVATLQQTYDSGNMVTTTDNRNLAITLADTTTDSNLLINIATGSTSKFAVQANGTDVLRVTSAGTIIENGGLTVLAGGASIAGGINNNNGGLSNAGAIGGVTTLAASGNITTAGLLIEKSVTFTPTTVGWYRIATGTNMMGGTIRIAAPLYDNTLTDLELQYNISGYGVGGSVQQTRYSSYNNGVVSAARISSDGVATLYLDIFVSSATSPQPITVYGYGPNQPAFISSPIVGVVAGSTDVNTLTLGHGFRTTQGAIFAQTGGNVGIGTSTTPGALLSIGGTTGNLTVDAAGNLSNGGSLRLSSTGALQNITGLTVISGGASITGNTSLSSGTFSASGGLISLNVGTNFGTSINTGTSNGTITLGGGSAVLVIDSTAFDVSSTGALSGITTIGLSGAIAGATSGNTINGLVINSGSLSSITNIVLSGSISGGTTITGTTINGTTGINTGAGAGTQRIDTNGNLTNIGSMSLTGSVNGLTYTSFNTAGANPVYQEGRLFYDNTQKALSYYNSEAAVTLNIGQENYIYVYNNTASTINDGQPVYINGSSSGVPTIGLAQADNLTTAQAVGVATHSIEVGTFGFVTNFGEVNNLNTSGFTVGDTLYVSATTAGAFTNSRPAQPNFTSPIGRVTDVNASTGKIMVIIGNTRFGAYTPGRLAFGGTDGDIKEDSNLHWDNTNKRLGIGTALPEQGLHIKGGNALIQQTGAGAGFIIDRTDGMIGSLKSGSAKVAFYFDDTGSFSISKDTRANIAAGNSAGTDVLTALASGNVGIGDSTPLATLTVGNGDLFQVAGATGNITTAGDLALNGGDLTATGALNFVSGGLLTINNNVNQSTSINVGTSTGTVTIGGGTAPLVINSTAFDVSATGGLSGITTINASGLATITGGATISGAAISLNASSNFAVNIGTGTSTGAISIGGGSNTFTVASTGIDISANAISDANTLTSVNNTNLTLNANGTGNLVFTGYNCSGNSNGGVLTTNASGVVACDNDDSGLSDARLKKNVRSLDDNILDKIKDVRTVNFDFDCDQQFFKEQVLDCRTDRQTGVIAQELAQIFPELVEQADDGYYRVKYDALSIYTLKAVSELASKSDSADTTGGVKTGGTLRLDSNGALQNITGLNMVSGGASIAGGINNNGGGLTGAGIIAGATNIDAQRLTITAPAEGNLLTLTKDSQGVFTVFNNGALEIKLNADKALAVKNKDGKDYFSISTNGGLVNVGSSQSDEQAVLLVLDSIRMNGDPKGVNGAQYYNSASNKFRCFQNDKWQDCLSAAATSEYVLVAQTQTWQQPVNEEEVPGEPRTWVDLSNARDLRLTARLSTAGAVTAKCRLQYASSDDGPWSDLSEQANAILPLKSSGSLKTEWAAISPDARKEVLVRVLCTGGNYDNTSTTGAIPKFSGIKLQIR